MFDQRLNAKTLRYLRKHKRLRSRAEAELRPLSGRERYCKLFELGREYISTTPFLGLWAMYLREVTLGTWRFHEPNVWAQADLRRGESEELLTPRFNKGLPLELYVIGQAARHLLTRDVECDAKLTEKEYERLLAEGTPFVLASLLHICGEKPHDAIVERFCQRFDELHAEDRFLLLTEADWVAGDRYELLPPARIRELRRYSLESLTMADIESFSLVGLHGLATATAESGERYSHLIVQGLRRLVAHPAHQDVSLVDHLSAHAERLVADPTLAREFKRAALEEAPLTSISATVDLLYQLSRRRYLPRTFLAKVRERLRGEFKNLSEVKRIRLFIALAKAGYEEPEFTKAALSVYLDSIDSGPIAEEALGSIEEFAEALTIVETLGKKGHLAQFLTAVSPSLEALHDARDLDAVSFSRFARVIDYQLPAKVAARSERRIRRMRKRRPTESVPERRFLRLLSRALPESLSVASAGFAHSYHFDAEITGEYQGRSWWIDCELDDRVHAVLDLVGDTVSTRGEDLIRDAVLKCEGVAVVRVPIDLIRRDDKEAIADLRIELWQQSGMTF